MITGYDFNKEDSPDAKQTISFLNEMQFKTNTTGKSNKDRNLIDNYYNKKSFTSIRFSRNLFSFRKLE